jgi:hypothetical protein
MTTDPKQLAPEKQPTLAEVAVDWNWRWEWEDNWEGICFNEGTKEKPNWAMLL